MDGSKMYNSREVGTELPELLKNERSLTGLFNEILNGTANFTMQGIKSDPETLPIVNASADLTNSDVITSFIVKVKEENEEKPEITRELVDYLPSSSDDKKIALLAPKNEINDETNGAVRSLNAPDENSFDCNGSSPLVDDAFAGKKTVRKQSNKCESKCDRDSDGIKLVDVSVKLEDIFSSDDRRLGRAHTNSRSCSCIYCCGEYSYARDMKHCSDIIHSKKRSTCLHSRSNLAKKFGSKKSPKKEGR